MLTATQTLLKLHEGHLVFDETSVEVLQFGLLKHGADPTLPEALLVLFGWIAELTKDPSRKAAGLEVLRAVLEVAPELECLRAVDFEARAAGLGLEANRRAPKIGEAAPAGSLKASSFLDPGMQRPARPGR